MLDNPRSDRIKQVAALSGRSARKRTGRILVEGPQAVRELLRFRPETVIDVYVTDEAAIRHEGLYEEAVRTTRWVHPVSDEVSRKISADSQGITAVADRAAVLRPPTQLEAVVGGASPSTSATASGSGSVSSAFVPASSVSSAARRSAMSVILPQMQDPGNVGTIIRTADAMGARAVFLCRTSSDPTNPKIIRASAGSVFHLPLIQVDFDQVISDLRARGVTIIGTAPGDRSEDVDEWIERALDGGSASAEGPALIDSPLSGLHAWVFGNEARGMSDHEQSSCDYLARIPMTGDAESLNAAAAAAICLHASSLVGKRSSSWLDKASA